MTFRFPRPLRRYLRLGLPLVAACRKLERAHRAVGLSLDEDRSRMRCRATGRTYRGRFAHTTEMLRREIA